MFKRKRYTKTYYKGENFKKYSVYIIICLSYIVYSFMLVYSAFMMSDVFKRNSFFIFKMFKV